METPSNSRAPDSAQCRNYKPELDRGDAYPQAAIRWALAQQAAHTCLVRMSRIPHAEEDSAPARP